MDSTSANLKRVSGREGSDFYVSICQPLSPSPKLVRKEHTHRKGVFVCFLFFSYVYLYWEICAHMSVVDHRSQKRAPDS